MLFETDAELEEFTIFLGGFHDSVLLKYTFSVSIPFFIFTEIVINKPLSYCDKNDFCFTLQYFLKDELNYYVSDLMSCFCKCSAYCRRYFTVPELWFIPGFIYTVCIESTFVT